ncbi:hypothetical protein [Dokdonia sp. PRO95]|uniref:hypothetical protein n=1 Tax=Dokdonia sp. PRO95 TaxID=1239415 RepID=UPI00054FC28B|nr:hypothetical protein [Dokdonia sp. PRO95]
MRTFLLLLILFSSLAHAQVGIGTTNPQADLHIAGDLLVQDAFKTAELGTVSAAEEDFELVTHITTSNPPGLVTKLDVSEVSAAPINVVNYTFSNLEGDNLTDVDLQFKTDKYIVAVANFQYIGDGVSKTTVNPTVRSMGTFVIRTFESGDSWHLEIGNRELDPVAGGTVTYKVTLVVYDKSYYRELPQIITNLGSSNSGTASSIPDLN